MTDAPVAPSAVGRRLVSGLISASRPAVIGLGWIRHRWRRSLYLRVAVSTLVLSGVVLGLLGFLLLQQVGSGLVAARQKSALAEATAELGTVSDLAARSEPGSETGVIIRIAQSALSRPVGASGFDVVILPGTTTPDATGLASPDDVAPASVPAGLRRAVSANSALPAYQYGRIRYTDRPAEPALVVGAPVVFPSGEEYDVYYLFPLRQEAATLSLVRRTVQVAGAALCLLLAGIAGLVTRQVVTPVRLAARTAERLASGRLTERMVVRGEDDLARLASSFNRMARGLQRQIEQLEELSRLQQRFVSDVSHELRTPLTTVRMAADVLHEARGDFPPQVARSAELLQAELERFETLLVDLLEISRYDAGVAVLEAEPIDVRTLVNRVVDSVGALVARRGCELVVRLPQQPCVAEVDPRRVERVLRNLLLNAIEHGNGLPVEVRLAADDDAVAVTVRDHGMGFRDGDADHVFRRFWRADPARTRRTGGTGLGLSIALEDAHLHGGWLQAWGALGSGAQFRLTLPRRARRTLVRSPLPLQPAATAAPSPATAMSEVNRG